jgi:ABC-type transport system involved in multi-copper enzyme maturation permease subunit
VVFQETLRRAVMSATYVIVGVFVAVLASASALMSSNSSSWQGLATFLLLILSSQLIGPEFSTGTLQLIMARPVNRSTYLLSRAAAVLVAGWLALWLPFLCYLVVRVGVKSMSDWDANLSAAIQRSLAMLLLVALVCFFGSFTRAYAHVALYVGGSIGFSILNGAVSLLNSGGQQFGALGRFVASNPVIARSVVWADRNLYPDVPASGFDRTWMVMVVSNALIALSLACFFFNRREVPYGAD